MLYFKGEENMSYFTTKQIEEIAIAKVKEMVRKSGNRVVDTQLSENDKGPSWDGHIILYNKPNTMKKEDIECAFLVQVKGTEVSKLSNKFHKFQVSVSDLRNSIAEGIIYFVVEIIAPKEEFRVFYKVMNSMEIQLILETIEKNKEKEQKTKNIKIDSILNEKTRFDKVCKDFKKYKDHHSPALVKKAIPLEKVDMNKLELITIPQPSEVLGSTVYPFVRDEYDHLIPVKAGFRIEEVIKIVKNDYILDGKKYFEEGKFVKNEDEEYFSFGDVINFYPQSETFKILKSQGTLLDRSRTIEFFVDKLVSKDLSKFTSEQLKNINSLIDDLACIKRIIKICENYNIDYKKIYTKNVLQKDINNIEILEKTLSDEQFKDNTKKFKEFRLEIMEFLGQNILLLKADADEDSYCLNFYSDEFGMTLSSGKDSKSIDISRYIILKRGMILCCNFDSEVVIRSLKSFDKKNIKAFSSNYIFVVLEFIKAYDETKNNIYLNTALHILNLVGEFVESEIVIINEAQIEYRLNKNLSVEMLDRLYHIKFNTLNNLYRAGVQVLLKDIKGFEYMYNNLSDNDKDEFQSFPLYNLYLDLKSE